MRSIVTGATGFVGSHLLPRLLSLGPVTTLQRPGGPNAVPPGCEALTGDITRPADLAALPQADVVVHLAAEASPQRAAADPAAARRVNVEGTRNVAQAAMERGAHLVFLSTGQVYGPSAGRPFREDDPLRPNGPYAQSKAEAEGVLTAMAQEGLRCSFLRCFNMYGPGQTGPYVVPDLMQALANAQTPRLRDLAPSRDFLYIEDSVAAMVLVARTRPQGPLNIGSGLATPIRELARLGCDLAGVPPPDGPSVSNDVLVADVSRLQGLGWRPLVPLREGLARTLAWWRSAKR